MTTDPLERIEHLEADLAYAQWEWQRVQQEAVALATANAELRAQLKELRDELRSYWSQS